MATKKHHQESQRKKTNYFFIALFLIALVLLFLLFKPYFSFLVLGAIIVVFLFPLNLYLRKKITNKIISSLIMTFGVILLVIIPTAYLGYTITKEATNVFTILTTMDYGRISATISETIGTEINIGEMVKPLTDFLVGYLSAAIPSLIGSISTLAVNLMLMFFLIYYGFKEGDVILEKFLKSLPMASNHKEELRDEAHSVLYGVLRGQFIIAIIQGFLGGLGFWIFGFPNPVFWGFIMAILSFLPVLGSPIVYIPASIIQIMQGNNFGGIAMIIYGSILIINIDNVLKPWIIGQRTGLHPMLVLLGIFGGIQFFGIIGMLIGPVVVALCILVIKFFNRDIMLT